MFFGGTAIKEGGFGAGTGAGAVMEGTKMA